MLVAPNWDNSAAAPAVRGVLQSSSSFVIGCRVGCRPSEIHRWRGTGGRRRKNAARFYSSAVPSGWLCADVVRERRGDEVRPMAWRWREMCIRDSNRTVLSKTVWNKAVIQEQKQMQEHSTAELGLLRDELNKQVTKISEGQESTTLKIAEVEKRCV